MSGVPFLLHPPGLPRIPGVRWFFTTRQGGVSRGAYAGFNLGHHVADDPAAVAANRSALLAALYETGGDASGSPRGLALLEQVHGVNTVTISAPADPPPEGDAQITATPGVVLGILTADCVPVLLADPAARVVGAAHAGWRGAVAGVVEQCLAAMAARGAQPWRTVALIGPCIRQPAYEVGEEVRAQFLRDDPANPPLAREVFAIGARPGHYHLDLPRYVRLRLARAGVAAGNTHDCGLCSYRREDDFFSHRRASQRGEAPCGRQLSGIWLA